MPFTPFHFGPGILIKSLAPRHVSLTAFAATQVVIDIESLYHLVRRDWPVHRLMHTLVGGAIVGVLTGYAVALGATILAPLLSRPLAESRMALVRSELSVRSAVIGGLVGGASHSLLDSMMHSDVRPYWPFEGSTLWNVVSVGALHIGCVLAGVVGVAAWALRRPGTTATGA